MESGGSMDFGFRGGTPEEVRLVCCHLSVLVRGACGLMWDVCWSRHLVRFAHEWRTHDVMIGWARPWSQVDWLGTKNQIDAASMLGNETHVIILSRFAAPRLDGPPKELGRAADDVVGAMQVSSDVPEDVPCRTAQMQLEPCR